MYREKIEAFLESAAGSSDIEYADTVKEMVEAAGEYMKRVAVLEAARATARLTMETEEYQECMEALDRSRSSAHDTLIFHVKVVNRICRSMGTALIFEGDESSRIEIADFAQQIINELFSTRKL